MKNKITKVEIEKLSELSALEFNEQEKENLINEVNNVIDMISGCDQVKVEKLHAINYHSLSDLREDIVKKDTTKLDAIINAPNCEQGFYVVPRVVD